MTVTMTVEENEMPEMRLPVFFGLEAVVHKTQFTRARAIYGEYMALTRATSIPGQSQAQTANK